jgi:hypothetical protein
MMHWTILADIVRALAAGVTAIIAALKFIQELRQKRLPPPEDIDPEADCWDETADEDPDEAHW